MLQLKILNFLHLVNIFQILNAIQSVVKCKENSKMRLLYIIDYLNYALIG